MNLKENILFVCGFPSGGTDLVKNILNAHPKIYICGEMPFIYHLHRYNYSAESIFFNIEEINELRNLLKKLDRWKNMENIDAEINSFPINIFEILKTWFTNRKVYVFGNKTPQNSEHIEDILKLFPQAQFLIVVRDIRDIALSWKSKWGKEMLYCAEKWNIRMLKMLEDVKMLRHDQFLIIRFEDILTDLETSIKSICDVSRVEWSTNMLEYDKHVKSIALDGKINYGKKIDSSNFNKWEKKLSKKNIKRIEEIAFEALNAFSYNIKYAEGSKRLTKTEKLHSIFNDVYAFFIIGNRFSKKNSFFERIKALINQVKFSILKYK